MDHYDKATRFGRPTPPSIMNEATRAKPMTAQQKHRQRFLDEEKAKTLRSLIAKYANSRRHFATVQQWRKELLELHEQF